MIDEAVAALGGDNFLQMQDRVETGRAYSFYREELNGLSHRQDLHALSNSSRAARSQVSWACASARHSARRKTAPCYLSDGKGYDISFRGARPLPDDTLERFKESTLRNVFYILRQRLGEPGLILESRASDVVENQSVDIVDITDADNRVVTVYFSQVDSPAG